MNETITLCGKQGPLTSCIHESKYCECYLQRFPNFCCFSLHCQATSRALRNILFSLSCFWCPLQLFWFSSQLFGFPLPPPPQKKKRFCWGRNIYDSYAKYIHSNREIGRYRNCQLLRINVKKDLIMNEKKMFTPVLVVCEFACSDFIWSNSEVACSFITWRSGRNRPNMISMEGGQLTSPIFPAAMIKRGF